MFSKDVREEPLRSVIQNCQRLIKDAEILLDKGSAGSALALAIMAFEEAGKGHSHELETKHDRKKGKISSSHQFRHLMCAIVLMASLHQKYGLSNPTITDEQREKIREKYEAAATFSEFATKPAPDEVREIIGKQIFDQLDTLPEDKRIIAIVELNWVKKIAKASSIGEVERLRQKGFYVDFYEHDFLSRPTDITRSDAYKWIWAAKRAVNLLAFGIYYQPYSELAAVLEKMPKPLPSAEEIYDMSADLAREFANAKAQSNFSEKSEFHPYEPFGEPPNLDAA